MGKLTVLQVKSIKAPGRYNDGNGLQLVVKESGAKSWQLRIQVNGRRRDIGLGSFNVVSLAEARDKAVEIRRQSLSGIDPVEARKAARQKAETIPTFAQAARQVFEERKGDWSNPKHRAQWLSTLETYAFPHIGSKKLDDISAGDVRALMVPIWQEKPETARRVLQRIGLVLDWAFSSGKRSSEAPMRTIRAGLAKQLKRPEHFASLPYADVPALISKLGAEVTAGRLALRFLIFTAARSGEVRGATWPEFDLEARLWTIPAHRMKAKREHVVPLSAQALAVLAEAKGLRKGRTNEPVFPGAKGRPLSDMTLAKVLRTALSGKWTVHGFRSSFRVWAAERTSFPSEVAEAALAHTIPDRVVAAYRRTDYLERRKGLMADWANFLSGVSSQPARRLGRSDYRPRALTRHSGQKSGEIPGITAERS